MTLPPASDPDLRDARVFVRYPYPIAAAWRDYRQSSRERKPLAAPRTLSIVLRTLLSYALAEHLASGRRRVLETHILEMLTHPSLGKYLDLLRALLEEEEGGRFVPELRTWLMGAAGAGKGTWSALTATVPLRNALYHDRAPTEAQEHEYARLIGDVLDRIVDELSFLERYRAFHVRATSSPESGRRAEVRWLVGADGNGLAQSIPVADGSPVRDDRVYLADATGTRLLDLSVFWAMRPARGTGPLRCHLVLDVANSGALRAQCDHEGSLLPVEVRIRGVAAPFSSWVSDPAADRGVPVLKLQAPLPIAFESDGFADVGALVDGRYEVRELLGEGGMARVYRVVDRTAEAAEAAGKALKVMRAELATDPVQLARFAREGEVPARVDHPGVMRVEARGALPDGRPYLLLPVAEGGSLKAKLAVGGLPTEQVQPWAEDALDALAALAREGLVHRDVKPGNLLLDGRGRTLLGDFGVVWGPEELELTRASQHLARVRQFARLVTFAPTSSRRRS